MMPSTFILQNTMGLDTSPETEFYSPHMLPMEESASFTVMVRRADKVLVTVALC